MADAEIGAEVFLDLDRYDNDINEAIGMADELDDRLSSIADEPIDIEATVDADASALEDIQAIGEEPVEIQADIETEAPEPDSPLGLLGRMAAGIIVFQAIINVAGTILDVLQSIQSFTLDPILDVEDSMARFAAQTGRSAEGMDDIINRLHFIGDVGEDFTDITNVLITANRLGIDSYDQLEEAALGALQTAKSQGVDATDTLRTMQILVDQGLAESFTEAADLLTAGIQNGNDRAGDLFNTLNSFGPMFAEMGLSGEQAMSLLNSGLDAGFRSASDVARAVDTMNKNITGADPGSAIDDALESIGLELPAQGEQVGEDFFNSVITGLQSHPEAADTAIEAIFGGRADKVSEAFGQLTLEDEAFSNLEGRANEAATTIDNSLRGVLDDFVLWAQSMISEILNSAEIDLPGKLTELKNRLQDALDAITSGAGFGEALEVALQIPGLNDTFQGIESGFGNFEIVLLQVVAALADLIGQAEVATQARQEVTRLAEGQLAFDIKVADNGQDITNAVSRAVARGVDAADVQSAIETAVTELISQGDIDQAQELLDSMQVSPSFVVDASAADNFAEQVQAGLLARNVEQIPSLDQAEIDRLVGEGILIPTTIDTTELQSQVDAARADIAASQVAAPVNPTEIRALTQPLVDARQASTELQTGFTTDMALIQAAGQETASSLVLSGDELTSAIQGADEAIHEATIGGSIVPDILAIGRAADTSFPRVVLRAVVMAVGMMTQSVIVTSAASRIVNSFHQIEEGSSALLIAATRANVLENALQGLGNTFAVLDALASKLADVNSAARNAMGSVQAVGNAGGNVTNNNTSVTVNQNNNVSNSAQAAHVSQQTATAVRGF